jgi:glycosyltransferase involved in cell wall biosynthesis
MGGPTRLDSPPAPGSADADFAPAAASAREAGRPEPMTMRISIGVLAYNESASIAVTIRSIAAQSLLRRLPPECAAAEIVCVPNGCTDDTADVARRAFDGVRADGLDPRVTCRVEAIAEGGKTNAWNEFVHRISDPSADYLVLMDGDVRAGEERALENLVSSLRAAPDAFLSTPRTVKHIELTGPRNLREFLSVHIGRMTRSRPGGFAGCLYCARGPLLRRIWFPRGMVGDDAFLHGMVVTELCRSKERLERLVRAPDSTVVFEAYTGVAKMYRALRRQAVIRGMDAVLWGFLWEHVGEKDAGELIRERNEREPGWYGELIRAHVVRSGWWVMPRGVVTRRWKYLRHLPPIRRVAYAPLAALAVAIDLVVHLDANRLIRKGRWGALWETTRTTKI